MRETKHIARITKSFLGREDHGIFTAMLYVDYGGTAQGIGGYSLDDPRRDDDGKFIGRFGAAEGMQFVINVLDACGVDQWEKLVGRTVYVIKDGDAWGKVLGIEPLPTETGKRFMFSEVWAEAVPA